MGFLIWFIVGILIVTIVYFVYFLIIKAVVGTVRGLRYWKRCREEYAYLIAKGYSSEEALLEISKKRRPDLAEGTHVEIVHKFSDIHLLVNFHINALMNAAKLDDEVVLEILRNTTIEHHGGYKYKVRTNWDKALRK